jgi:hypothetical protein
MSKRAVSPGQLERDLRARLAGLNEDLDARRQTSSARYVKQARARRGSRRRASVLAALLSVLAIGAVNVFADGGTLDVQVADADGYAVDRTTDGAIVEYIGKDNTDFGASGSGIFESFLQTQDSPKEEGYNTDGDSEFDTGSSPTFNHAILVSEIPTVPCESIDESETADGLCWELFSDINDSNANNPQAPHIQLTDLEVWFTDDDEITGYDQGGSGFDAPAAKAYDFSGTILINDVNSGSGRGDLRYLIPLESLLTAVPADCGFGDSDCDTYFVVYNEWGDTDEADPFISDSGFEEWKVKRYPFVDVEKTAVAEFTRTFAWAIDKTVDPATWDLFEGDTGTSEYTVTVEKDAGTDSDPGVSGVITITNTSEKTASITSVADVISGGPTNGDVDCGVDFPYALAKGDVLECTYSADLPDTTDQTNTATVTLAEGTVFQGTADVDFGDPTTVVNDSINVTDTVEGDLGEFSDDDSVSYETTFACDEDEGEHDNTATIDETDQSASAKVTVNCYDLDVTKDADEALTRTYEWSIDKSSDDPAELTLMPGETYDYPYDVTVDMTGSTDSGFAVSGAIHVKNDAPIDAVITDVADVISDVGDADSVDCGGATFPYTLAGNGGTLDCTYDSLLPDDADRTNTATATNQNYDYDSEGVGTESGTTDYTGTADVDFDGADMSEVDECIDVTDTLKGFLGTVCVDDVPPPPKTFSYTRTISPTEEDCDGITIMNTASFETNDTATTDDADWTVVVTVPCDQGCTLTQGYWKTHSDYGPAKKSDATWDLLAGGLGPDTTFFLSGQTWYEVFWTAPKKGNAYYQLAHQYMAAKLNILAGASSTASVDAAITWAETFFSTYTPSNWPKGLKTTIVQNAGVLGSYNEGVTGPGHCDEDAAARRGNLVG